MDGKNKILLSEANLIDYFYRQLSEVNKVSTCPLPEEFLLYSSQVMDKFAFSENYYEAGNKETVLGMELLKAEQKSFHEKKEIYKDIGDKILFQLGMFPERVNKKSPSKSYYLNIGRSAYSKAAALDCSFYDIPNFYNMLSTSLESLIKVLTHLAERLNYDSIESYILDNSNFAGEFDLNKKKLAN